MKPPLPPRARAVGLLAPLLLAGALAGRAQVLDVQTHTLTNGMKLLVHEDHSIPNAAMFIFFRIGSRNERPGTTGISHFFEHMMFNGARKYGPKQFDRVMEAAGGANNAYTDYDVTVYMNWFPVSVLELIFELEADRIAHLSFDPKMVESERGVVMSERRTSIEANNAGILDEQLWAAAFTAHPYQWPILGWLVDIEHWKMDDLKRHFAMGYSPANATMVLAGSVKFEEVVALAKRHLEPIPAHDPPPPVTTREPEQAGERRVRVTKYAQLPILMVAYHVPEARHADYHALQILARILFAGQSSRLYQRLVRKDQLAIEVSGGMNTAMDPALFVINIQPREGVLPEKIERVLYEELARAQDRGIDDRELQKAKNILVADFYRNLKTLNGKARALGNAEIFFGDYRRLFTTAEDLDKVTRADVQRVAKAWFVERNRTVATLVPEKAAPATTAGAGR